MIAGEAHNKKDHIYDDGKISLLKFAAIYGANASGKTNFVKILHLFQKTVLSGLPMGHTGSYCRINPDNRDRESYFEIELMLKGKYYAYGFEVILNSGRFISEWLVELTADGKEAPIFSRDITSGEYIFGKSLQSKALLEKLNVYAEDVKYDSTILFLSLMNKNKKNLYENNIDALALKDVYDWIGDSLSINEPHQPVSNFTYMSKAENVDEICRIISAFGTGITGFEMIDLPPDRLMDIFPRKVLDDVSFQLEQRGSALKNSSRGSERDAGIGDIPEGKGLAAPRSVGTIIRSNKDFFVIEQNIDNDEVRCKTIQFSHGAKNVLFDISEESDGTVRILDLIEILVSENGDKTYIIDELDRCLHPSLSYKFVETFLELAGKRNIQLIVTTHESRLMDFDLLRRDEIWFVDKNKNGESEIYSLDEYNARFDQKIDKAYLEGRYGGVPIFSTVFPVKE